MINLLLHDPTCQPVVLRTKLSAETPQPRDRSRLCQPVVRGRTHSCYRRLSRRRTRIRIRTIKVMQNTDGCTRKQASEAHAKVDLRAEKLARVLGSVCYGGFAARGADGVSSEDGRQAAWAQKWYIMRKSTKREAEEGRKSRKRRPVCDDWCGGSGGYNKVGETLSS